MSIDRYFVDERGGCIAVRDKTKADDRRKGLVTMNIDAIQKAIENGGWMAVIHRYDGRYQAKVDNLIRQTRGPWAATVAAAIEGLNSKLKEQK